MALSEVITLLAMMLLLSMLFRLDGRVAIAVSLGLLISVALTSAKGNSDLANHLAIYMYYFLAAGVLLILVENLKIVPEAWSQRCRDFVISNLSAAGSDESVTVSRGLDEVSNRTTYDVARIFAKRLEILDRTIFGMEDKRQLERAKDIQDELRAKIKVELTTDDAMRLRYEKIGVLDTSVILGWFSESELTTKALEVRQSILDGEMRTIIPDEVLYEVDRALRNSNSFSPDDIVVAIESLRNMSLQTRAVPSTLMKAAAKLAQRYEIGIRDALKVALARDIGADFVTADRRLYEKTKQLGFVKLIKEGD